MEDLRELTRRFPIEGRVEALFVRPARDVPARPLLRVLAIAGRGLEGDRSASRVGARPGGHKRQVTLIQSEHLPVIASWLGRAAVEASTLRRNIVIAGFNLLAARTLFPDQPMRIVIGDDVSLVVTGPCEPCSKMEAAFGPGAYNALRGHGGLTVSVAVGGHIAVGDRVRVVRA